MVSRGQEAFCRSQHGFCEDGIGIDLIESVIYGGPLRRQLRAHGLSLSAGKDSRPCPKEYSIVRQHSWPDEIPGLISREAEKKRHRSQWARITVDRQDHTIVHWHPRQVRGRMNSSRPRNHAAIEMGAFL